MKAWAFLVNRSNGFTTRAVVQPQGGVKPLNVVEVRIVVQNTGLNGRLAVRNDGRVGLAIMGGGQQQQQRSHVYGFNLVNSDPRLAKRVTDISGRALPQKQIYGGAGAASGGVVAALYESFVVHAHVNVAGCLSEHDFYKFMGEVVMEASVENTANGSKEELTLRIPINELNGGSGEEQQR